MWGLFKKKTQPTPVDTTADVPVEIPAAPVVEATPTPTAVVVATPATPEEKKGWLDKLKSGLTATRNKLGLNILFAGKLDEETLEQLEAQLLMADCGMPATQHLLDDLRKRWKQAGGTGDPRAMLVSALTDLLKPLEQPFKVAQEAPFVIMIAGVNGAGKTTSIGKLAKYLQGQGASVLLAAGDTFSRGSPRATRDLGRTQQRHGDPASRRRPGGRDV